MESIVHLQRSNNNISQVCTRSCIRDQKNSNINSNRVPQRKVVNFFKASTYDVEDKCGNLFNKENNSKSSTTELPKQIIYRKPFRYRIFSHFPEFKNSQSYQNYIFDESWNSKSEPSSKTFDGKTKIDSESDELNNTNNFNIEIMKDLLKKVGWPREKDSFESDYCSWSETSLDRYNKRKNVFNVSNKFGYNPHLPMSKTQKFIIDSVFPNKKSNNVNVNAYFEESDLNEIEEKFVFLKSHSSRRASLVRPHRSSIILEEKNKNLFGKLETKTKTKGGKSFTPKIGAHISDTVSIMRKLTDIDFHMPDSVFKVLRAKRCLMHRIKERRNQVKIVHAKYDNGNKGIISKQNDLLLWKRKKLLKTEEIVAERLETLMSHLDYRMACAVNMPKVVTASIRKSLKDVFDPLLFRTVVFVSLFQDLGQDCHLVSKCLMNYLTDDFCWKTYSSKDLSCTVCVFWIQNEAS